MSMEAVSRSAFLSAFEPLRLGRDIVRTAGQALLSLSDCLVDESCQADVSQSGQRDLQRYGQSRRVGQKTSAALASTGTHSHFLHPGEALHGVSGERSLT
jgi:arabinose-5-phosphate isomerase